MRVRIFLGLFGVAFGLAACAPKPVPLPTNGPIIYSCADGTQLSVTYAGEEARVAIVGGPSVALPNTGSSEAPYYSNGRYGLRGRGAAASWEVGRAAAVNCRGG